MKSKENCFILFRPLFTTNWEKWLHLPPLPHMDLLDLEHLTHQPKVQQHFQCAFGGDTPAPQYPRSCGSHRRASPEQSLCELSARLPLLAMHQAQEEACFGNSRHQWSTRPWWNGDDGRRGTTCWSLPGAVGGYEREFFLFFIKFWSS